MKPKTWLLIALTGAAVAGGCAEQVQMPPHNLVEYQRQQRLRPGAYPTRTIVLHNLQRVLDRARSDTERMDSLELAGELGGGDPSVLRDMAAILSEGETSQELRQAVLKYLMQRDYTDLSGHVVSALPSAEGQGQLRETMLDWLIKHPQRGALTEVVKLWAQERSTTGINEPRFRYAVEQISGKTWDAALLDSINKPSFFARGSALEILADRISTGMLKSRILARKSRTKAMAALQAFVDRFDYVPSDRQEFLATASIYATSAKMLDDAAAVCKKWREDYGYRFNIRDFHLLSRLAADPLRTMFRRTQLALELGQTLGGRQHYRHVASRVGAADDYTDGFWTQAENLTMVDLWNIYLLSEMLSRPRVQLALRVVAQRDRADRSGAWGGLVFYESGQAEAKIYPIESSGGGGGDLVYIPSKLAIQTRRDALCQFSMHFENSDNGRRAGANSQELRDAKEGNYYGLILTSVSPESFCAHYYSPQRAVVSLGVFPFGR